MDKTDLIKSIATNLGTIRKPGEVAEVRILHTRQGTISGYFDDWNLLASAVSQYVGKHDVYTTLNPVKPDLLARCANRLQANLKPVTGDGDIAAISYILVDVDPVRSPGISSAKPEKDAAFEVAKAIRDSLAIKGFPEPFFCDSGNGFHMLIPTALENTQENVALLKDALGALDFLHSTGRAVVDLKTYNPSRITKLYGTMACKGDDTPERPHRWSRIIKAPETPVAVSRELLQELVSQPPVITQKRGKTVLKSGGSLDLDKWITDHGLDLAYKAPFQGLGTKYILGTCPWDGSHRDRSAYIIQFDNGATAAGCHHNGCQGQDWQTLRELLEPGGCPEAGVSADGSQADRIISLANGCDYFSSDIDEPFAAALVAGHWEVMQVKSKRFKMYLTKLYYDDTGHAPGSDAMAQATALLEATALFSGNKRQLQNRVCAHCGDFYYDLCDPGWRALRITAGGCSIEDHPPILFTRGANMDQQADPDFSAGPGDLLGLVRKHFTFKTESDTALFAVYLVSCFLPEIAHPLLVLYGEKGASKSTTMRMVKRLVDPAKQDLQSMPSSKQNLAIMLANTYMPAFDNQDSLSAEKSDMLCMAATGGAFSKRTLYSDADETILRFKRCVTLNGINVVAVREDLLDRSIVLELQRIHKSDRRTELDVWSSFEADRPSFLGAIFNSVSAAMTVRPGVTLSQAGRMADFTFWGYAIAEVIGIGGEVFLGAYLGNQERANEEALASNPVASAVIALMRNRSVWSGSVSELLEAIENVAERERINTRVNTWPKDPHWLSNRLKAIKSNLEEVGIFYDIRHAGNFKRATIENHNSPVSTVRRAPDEETEDLDDLNEDSD